MYALFLLGILCGSCVNNTGVGVLSLTCLETCHPYVGGISIAVLGNHIISCYLGTNFFVLFSTLEWNFSNIISIFVT